MEIKSIHTKEEIVQIYNCAYIYKTKNKSPQSFVVNDKLYKSLITENMDMEALNKTFSFYKKFHSHINEMSDFEKCVNEAQKLVDNNEKYRVVIQCLMDDLELEVE